MMGGGDGDIELFMRNVLQMENQPHIAFFSPGMEAREPGQAARTEEKPEPGLAFAIAQRYADENGFSIGHNVRTWTTK